jgi:hypothetical protein
MLFLGQKQNRKPQQVAKLLKLRKFGFFTGRICTAFTHFPENRITCFMQTKPKQLQ